MIDHAAGLDLFSVYVPWRILKAADEAEPMTARIGGIVSTDKIDQQGEAVLQKGIDWSYFLSKGWFNHEHQPGPENILGYPESVVYDDSTGVARTRVEGVLTLAKSKAREVYETAMALQKAGAARSLGFSVEGSVTAREGKKIVGARVLNVAITAHPVNPDARLEVLARSLMATQDRLVRSTTVGYLAPASGGGSICAITPQSLEGASPRKGGPTLSSETFALNPNGDRAEWLEHFSDADLEALMVLKRFPDLRLRDAARVAASLR